MLIAPLLALLTQAADPKLVESLPPLVEGAQAVSPDHRLIALATLDTRVWILDIATRTVTAHVPPGEARVESLAWSEDGSLLALLRSNASLDVVDAVTGSVRTTMRTTIEDPVRWADREVRFAAGGKAIVVALGGRATDVLNAADGKRIAQLPEVAGSAATAMALSSDRELLALCDGNGAVGIWTVRTGKPLAYRATVPLGSPPKLGLGATQRGTRGLAFDPTGKTLAIGCGDCTVRLWNFASDEPMRELSHCDADMFGDLAIGSVAFSRDGSRLLAASWSYWELRVWDLSSGLILDHYDYGGGNPSPQAAWFAANDQYIVASVGCRFAKIEGDHPVTSAQLGGWQKLIPGGHPTREEWARWQHEGDYAWAVVDHHLVVRKIPDEQPLLKLRVREK